MHTSFESSLHKGLGDSSCTRSDLQNKSHKAKQNTLSPEGAEALDSLSGSSKLCFLRARLERGMRTVDPRIQRPQAQRPLPSAVASVSPQAAEAREAW